MRGSIFIRGGGGGGPGQSDKKSSDVFFFCFFLVLSLFYRGQFERNLSFFKVPELVQHFPGGGGGGGGGVQVSFSRGGGGRGGSNCLFPIETHITCDFPGGVRTPCPPLWIRTCADFISKLTFSYYSFSEQIGSRSGLTLCQS